MLAQVLDIVDLWLSLCSVESLLAFEDAVTSCLQGVFCAVRSQVHLVALYTSSRWFWAPGSRATDLFWSRPTAASFLLGNHFYAKLRSTSFWLFYKLNSSSSGVTLSQFLQNERSPVKKNSFHTHFCRAHSTRSVDIITLMVHFSVLLLYILIMYNKALMENYTSLFTTTKIGSQVTSDLHSPVLGFSAGHH